MNEFHVATWVNHSPHRIMILALAAATTMLQHKSAIQIRMAIFTLQVFHANNTYYNSLSQKSCCNTNKYSAVYFPMLRYTHQVYYGRTPLISAPHASIHPFIRASFHSFILSNFALSNGQIAHRSSMRVRMRKQCGHVPKRMRTDSGFASEAKTVLERPGPRVELPLEPPKSIKK